MTEENSHRSICNPQLRDPLTIAFSFLPNPSPWRLSCRFMLDTYNHGIYLESHKGVVENGNGNEMVPPASYIQDLGENGKACPIFGWRGISEPRSNTPSHPPVHQVQAPLTSLANAHLCELCLVDLPLVKALQSTDFRMYHGSAKHKSAFFPGFTLQKLTVLNLPLLENIHNDFLAMSPELQEARFENLPALEKVGNGWLWKCPKLERVYCKQLPKLTSVGSLWCANCERLQTFECEVGAAFPSLKKVGDWWLAKTALYSIVLKVPTLFRVGDGWLYRCKMLNEVCFEFHSLRWVGSQWLSQCSDLEQIKLTHTTPNIKSIGSRFLAQCRSLKEAVFQNLLNLDQVGALWMLRCTSLRRVHFENLPKADLVWHWSFGGSARCRWLYGCPDLDLRCITESGSVSTAISARLREELKASDSWRSIKKGPEEF